MTTPIQQKIRDKKRTAAQILDMVKSGDWIQPGTAGGDATEVALDQRELRQRHAPCAPRVSARRAAARARPGA